LLWPYFNESCVENEAIRTCGFNFDRAVSSHSIGRPAVKEICKRFTEYRAIGRANAARVDDILCAYPLGDMGERHERPLRIGLLIYLFPELSASADQLRHGKIRNFNPETDTDR
jgi:hypothetical protein